jgi:hypothetical protein
VRAEVQKQSQQVSNQSNVRLHVYDFVSVFFNDDDMLQTLQMARLKLMEVSEEFRQSQSLAMSQDDQYM